MNNEVLVFTSAAELHYLELRRAGASRNVAAAYASTIYNVDGSVFEEVEQRFQEENN